MMVLFYDSLNYVLLSREMMPRESKIAITLNSDTLRRFLVQSVFLDQITITSTWKCLHILKLL